MKTKLKEHIIPIHTPFNVLFERMILGQIPSLKSYVDEHDFSTHSNELLAMEFFLKAVHSHEINAFLVAEQSFSDSRYSYQFKQENNYTDAQSKLSESLYHFAFVGAYFQFVSKREEKPFSNISEETKAFLSFDFDEKEMDEAMSYFWQLPFMIKNIKA